MNQKTFAIIIVAVLAMAVIVVAIDSILQNEFFNANDVTIGDEVANSLQFSVDIVDGSESANTLIYSSKNINSPDFMVRIKILTTEGEIIYVINEAQQKVWTKIFDKWTESISNEFSSELDLMNSWVEGYIESLVDWSGEDDWTYTEDDMTYKIYDIVVNPSLADSLFEPN